MDSLSWQLSLALLSAVMVNGWIVRHFFRRMPDQILLGAVAVFYFLQCVFLIAYLLLTGSALLLIGPEVTPNLNDTPFLLFIGHVLMPVVALAVAKFFTRPHQLGALTLLQKVNSRRILPFEIILCVFSVGLLLYFVGTIYIRVPYLSPMIIYAHISFYMTPMLIGLCWRRYRLPAVIFLGAMVVGGVFALAAGSRSLLFLPMLFFVIGVWFTLNRRHRIWSGCIGVVLLVPVFQLSALIENVRKEGQIDTSGSVISRVGEVILLSKQASATEQSAEGLARGMGRMIMWSNVVALSYCPDKVPYRGFDDFWAEFAFLNRSTLFEDAQENIAISLEQDFGIGGAKILGFGIAVGGVVPFPILADGWLRAGLLGAALFSAVMCLLWACAEKAIRSIYAHQPHYMAAFIVILLSSAYDRMGVYGFIYNLRYLAMQLILWGTVFYFIGKVLSVGRATLVEGARESGLPVREPYAPRKRR